MPRCRIAGARHGFAQFPRGAGVRRQSDHERQGVLEAALGEAGSGRRADARRDQFYEIYSGVARRMAARYRLRRDEAEDLNQEVWTRVVAHLPKFEWRGDARGLRVWLYKLVARQAIDLLRKRNRLRARRTALAGDQLEAAATPPVRLWRKTWKQELVHVLLADLRKKVSPLNYQLLHLRWMEQQSLAERAALNVYQGEPFAGE